MKVHYMEKYITQNGIKYGLLHRDYIKQHRKVSTDLHKNSQFHH